MLAQILISACSDILKSLFTPGNSFQSLLGYDTAHQSQWERAFEHAENYIRSFTTSDTYSHGDLNGIKSHFAPKYAEKLYHFTEYYGEKHEMRAKLRKILKSRKQYLKYREKYTAKWNALYREFLDLEKYSSVGNVGQITDKLVRSIEKQDVKDPIFEDSLKIKSQYIDAFKQMEELLDRYGCRSVGAMEDRDLLSYILVFKENLSSTVSYAKEAVIYPLILFLYAYGAFLRVRRRNLIQLLVLSKSSLDQLFGGKLSEILNDGQSMEYNQYVAELFVRNIPSLPIISEFGNVQIPAHDISLQHFALKQFERFIRIGGRKNELESLAHFEDLFQRKSFDTSFIIQLASPIFLDGVNLTPHQEFDFSIFFALQRSWTWDDFEFFLDHIAMRHFEVNFQRKMEKFARHFRLLHPEERWWTESIDQELVDYFKKKSLPMEAYKSLFYRLNSALLFYKSLLEVIDQDRKEQMYRMIMRFVRNLCQYNVHRSAADPAAFFIYTGRIASLINNEIAVDILKTFLNSSSVYKRVISFQNSNESFPNLHQLPLEVLHRLETDLSLHFVSFIRKEEGYRPDVDTKILFFQVLGEAGLYLSSVKSIVSSLLMRWLDLDADCVTTLTLLLSLWTIDIEIRGYIIGLPRENPVLITRNLLWIIQRIRFESGSSVAYPPMNTLTPEIILFLTRNYPHDIETYHLVPAITEKMKPNLNLQSIAVWTNIIKQVKNDSLTEVFVSTVRRLFKTSSTMFLKHPILELILYEVGIFGMEMLRICVERHREALLIDESSSRFDIGKIINSYAIAEHYIESNGLQSESRSPMGSMLRKLKSLKIFDAKYENISE